MITCPKCKTTGIPEDAKFCPNCGTSLCPPETIKQLTVSECRIVPNAIKNGERCKLFWKGENVKFLEIDYTRYNASEEIILTPSQSHTYNVTFYGEGYSLSKQVKVELLQNFINDGKGEEILSPDSFKMQKENERRNQLNKEAEQAWEKYPNKPQPKKNPHKILFNITLLLTPLALVLAASPIGDEYSTICAVSMCILIVLDVIFGMSISSFDPNEEVKTAKKKFIADYIATHKK